MINLVYIVACMLKARKAEPEETAIAWQWLGKHVSVATDVHT
jgi:hypothetical protein